MLFVSIGHLRVCDRIFESCKIRTTSLQFAHGIAYLQLNAHLEFETLFFQLRIRGSNHQLQAKS